MGISDRFGKFLKSELDCRAVWPPVLTPIQLGDYGVTDGASFQKLGNLADFGLTLEIETGRASSLNLTSSGVKQTRLALGAAVPAFQGLGDVAGKLGVEFARGETFLLKCSRLERTQIRNLGALALRLSRMKTPDGQSWKHLSWKIVWQLYTGQDVVFIATRSAGTRVEFSGSAAALHQLEMGKMSAGIGVQSSHSLGVEILGETGPVGYALARVKVIGAGVHFLGGDIEDEETEAVEILDNDDTEDTADSDDITDTDDTTDEALSLAEEPASWDALEDAETDPRDLDDGPMAFADEPIDSSSRAHWLQSCLRRLIDPDLVVDGAVGLRSRRALKVFQRQTPGLRADGVAGPQTIAALMAKTGSVCPGIGDTAPAASEDGFTEPEPVTATTTAEFTAQTVDQGGTLTHIVRGGDDEVRFSYFSRAATDAYNVSSYRGGKTGLLRDEDLRALGHPPGAIKIFRANADKESRGLFGAVNTWDDQRVSWGVSQFAGRAGTLAALLAELHDEPATRAAFERFFVANGVTVAHGPYLTRRSPAGEKHTGWHVVVDTPAGPLTGDDAWAHVRRTPRLIGAFMLAGNDRSIQLGQVKFWLDHFLTGAVRKVVVRGPQGDRRICDYLTSEYGLALIVRLYNWMPAYVQPWFTELSAELARRHPDLDLTAPATWARHPALEPEFCELVKDRRRAVKRGSYDTYALELDRSRGSYSTTGSLKEQT